MKIGTNNGIWYNVSVGETGGQKHPCIHVYNERDGIVFPFNYEKLIIYV